MSGVVTVRVPELRAALTGYLESEGLDPEHADWAAAYLVDAEQSGIKTHGLAHLGSYVRLLRAGTITARPELSVLARRGSTLTLDGGNGLGQVVGTWMMAQAAEVVRDQGAALVTVRSANHLGALGYYFRLAAVAGMGGMLTQVTAPMMLSTGAAAPRLGNNPIAIALPGGQGAAPLILDISCSETSRSRIRQALRDGPDTPVPPTWALAPDGTPATTASEAFAGALLPMAGHKGSGLSTMLGGLAGVLSGGAFGGQVTFPDDAVEPRNVGYFLVLFDTSAFLPDDEYSARMAEYVDYVVSAPLAPGVDRLRVPGQRSAASRVDAADVVTVVGRHWADLTERLEGAELPVPGTV